MEWLIIFASLVVIAHCVGRMLARPVPKRRGQ